MWIVVGTLGVVAATIVVGVWADRRFGLIPRKERLQPPPRPALPPHAPGEAPATALDALAASYACPACATPLARTSDDPIAFDAHALRVVRLACPRCATVRSIYVREAS